MVQDTKHWVAFNRIPGIGRVRFGLLEQYFGSLGEAWAASSGGLRAAGLDSRTVGAIEAMRPSISPDAEMEALARAGVGAITIRDAAYPSRLKEIFDPPPVLYVKGSLIPEDEWSVTVVGTRTPTAYGREIAARLSRDLARNSITVMSGLARGIDAVAHQATMEAGGRTVGVQACGLDMVYPPGHANLARQMVGRGAVISDYPLGTRPRAEFFPRRNRILAGLTLGTLVVEAGEKSGALITASFAAEEGREVMAVPGSILSPFSRGANRLIQDGAKAILDVGDILEELNLRVPARQMELPGIAPVSNEETALLKIITQEPLHIDDIRRSAGLPIAAVSSTLAVLELKGLVKQVGPMNYILVRGLGRDATAPSA